jgi:hypothetical protein
MLVAGCRSVDHRCWPSERSHSFNGISCWNEWQAVEEDFVLLEVAESGATGSGPSESSYSNYGISCGVEWIGVEGSGSSERGLRGLYLWGESVKLRAHLSAPARQLLPRPWIEYWYCSRYWYKTADNESVFYEIWGPRGGWRSWSSVLWHCVVCEVTLKMDVTRTSEALVTTYDITRRHKSKYHDRHTWKKTA